MAKEFQSTTTQGTGSGVPAHHNAYLPVQHPWPYNKLGDGHGEPDKQAVTQTNEELNMLDRWLAESPRQSPWNHIAAVGKPRPAPEDHGSKGSKRRTKKVSQK